MLLYRYIAPVAALCAISMFGADADEPQIRTSNARLEVVPASGDNLGQHRSKRSSVVTDEDIVTILDAMNAFRRNVSPGPPSDMEYMEWDEDLATMAQQWSDGCYYGHGQPDNLTPYTWIGQNLYASSNDGTTVVNAATAWNNEDQYYDYDSGACSDVCGHYTQNVWATSNRIGCGIRFCNDPDGLSWSTANIITCNYGPGGNYQGEMPYKLGPYCTECQSGSGQCDLGLCRPCEDHSAECVCEAVCQNCGTVTDDCMCECQDGWLGPDCSQECVNTHEYCGANPGWPTSWCDSEHQYVLDGCPLMCGLCVVADPNFVCEECALDCGSGGTCQNDPDGVESCDCFHGWTGDMCTRATAYCPCEGDDPDK